MAKNVSFGSRFNSASKSPEQKVREEYEFRPIAIDRLIPLDEDISNAEFLRTMKASILMSGVRSPILVRPENEDSIHFILDGRYKHRACTELVREGHERFAIMMCRIIDTEDRSLESLEMIADDMVRKPVLPGDIRKNIERIEALAADLKARKVIQTDRAREYVAELLNISHSKIALYHKISTHLPQELLEAFDGGDIGITHADAIASLAPDEAASIVQLYSEAGADAVKELVAEGKRQQRSIKRPFRGNQQLYHEVRRILSDIDEGVPLDPKRVKTLFQQIADLLKVGA